MPDRLAGTTKLSRSIARALFTGRRRNARHNAGSSKPKFQNLKQHSLGYLTSNVIRIDRRFSFYDRVIRTASETHVAEYDCWVDCGWAAQKAELALRARNTDEMLMRCHWHTSVGSVGLKNQPISYSMVVPIEFECLKARFRLFNRPATPRRLVFDAH